MSDRNWRTKDNKGRFAKTTKSLKERFEEKIEMIPECGCWIWMGNIQYPGSKRQNYGRIFDDNHKRCFAHRISWELYKGPIPKGMFILHHCDTQECVNPNHLFAGTAKDNVHDAIKKKRFKSVVLYAPLRRKYKWTHKTASGPSALDKMTSAASISAGSLLAT